MDTKPQYKFSKSDFKEYVNYFAYVNEHDDSCSDVMLQTLAQLQNDVSEYILGSISDNEEYIETLLINLLGHEHPVIRSSAIKYLN